MLALTAVLGGCGAKDTGVASTPRPDSPAVDLEPSPATPADEGGTGETAEGEDGEADAAERLTLDVEFHRTRVGLGVGLWVLGIVHNPHPHRVAQVRVRVRLLDAEDQPVGEALALVPRSLAPGERAAVAVPLTEPVAHEQLRMRASAVLDPGPEPPPSPLRLAHEPPQRAEFGGWYVIGTVENTGAAAVSDAHVEIQALDDSGELLGVDWLALDPVDPGETLEFDVGELRYEQAPSRFLVQLRSW